MKININSIGDRTYALSVIIFLLCLMLSFILIKYVKPITINETAKTQMSLFASVSSMLAAGCTKSYYSFSYKEVEKLEARSMRITAILLIFGIFVFTFLAMYCLRKSDVFSFLDNWAVILLFLGTFSFLNGIILLERWDSSLLKKK